MNAASPVLLRPMHFTRPQAITAIREKLATLPRRERDVVSCLDVVGLSIADTAEALGMSESAVRVARHRGLKRLRGSVTATT